MNDLTKFTIVIGLTTATVASVYCCILLISKTVDHLVGGPRCKKCQGKILRIDEWRRKK